MSRTIRAQSGDRWWKNGRGRCLERDHEWKERAESYMKYWESDIPDRWGIVKIATKQQHREVSRADTRTELRRIMKDVEYDFYNREKLYKGFCWNWD